MWYVYNKKFVSLNGNMNKIFKDGGAIYFNEKNENINFSSNCFLNSSAGRVNLRTFF